MVQRLIVAAIGIPLLMAVLLVFPPVCLPVALCLLCALSAYELLWATGAVRKPPLAALAILTAGLVPFLFYFDAGMTGAGCALFLFFTAAAIMAIARHETVRFQELGMTFFAAFLVPSMLSTLVPMSDLPGGRYYLLLPFVTAFLSDGLALFVGMRFGRRKLAPKLSPKKTVEGSLGGFGGSVAGCIVYGVVVQSITGGSANFLQLILLGILGSFFGQLGDLFFSWIKREFYLKDYGNLLPGHGGVLDRFDSVTFTAPLTLLLLQFCTFFTF